MTNIACTEPGCTGSIVDGYCDVCGTPAASSTSAPSAATSAPASGACAQPGCSGTIVDGYCDVCGTPGGTGSSAAPAHEQISSVSTVSRASNRLASTPLGSARATQAGSKLTRKLGTSSTRLRGARLGAGLTHVPPIPAIDASKAILANPMVPEDRRNCPTCGNAVGRSRGDQPGRTEGFCPKCRSPFSFSPKLKAGDLVGGQYEVAGALAHGGFGWIYMARDLNVQKRWVVLKGLLNSEDPDAVAAAIAEQQFLARVEHPLIVEIYNFVTHEGAGYIVMEYVGGTSLKTLLKQRMEANGGRYNALPIDQAIAYMLEILPAFSYLHDLGLVYCDFKPDNIIQVGDAVKLIDLGGVRRIDDMDSAIYGTVGYQAPEVPEVGTSVASDIFTLGRTLTVLAMEFRGYQSTYLSSLPPVADVPLFQQHDSVYRLLLKACAKDPADRFVSADEFRVQLLGVLREVVASQSKSGAAQHSASSLLFGSPGDLSAGLGEAAPPWMRLPSLLPDETDKMAGWLKTVSVPDPAARLELLVNAPEQSAQVLLEIALAALESGQFDMVDTAVVRPAGRGPVGVARGLDVRTGRLGTQRQRGCAVGLQRGLRSGAWRAGAQARAGVWPVSSVASTTSPRGSTSPAPGPTPTTSHRPRSGWQRSARPAATSTEPSPRSTWCRRPAARSSGLAASEPVCWQDQGVDSPPSQRPWAVSRR